MHSFPPAHPTSHHRFRISLPIHRPCGHTWLLAVLMLKLTSLLLGLHTCSPSLVRFTLSSFSDRQVYLPHLLLSSLLCTCCWFLWSLLSLFSFLSPENLDSSWLWMDSRVYFLHLNILITFFASKYCKSCRIYWVPSPSCSPPRYSFTIQSHFVSKKRLQSIEKYKEESKTA